jgi:starch phosphorylase
MNIATKFSLEVQPVLPKALSGLEELANDLYYSWDRQVRNLFYRLDQDLWEACRHNPKVFLRRISQQRLQKALKDRGFLEAYHQQLSVYNSYHREGIRTGTEHILDPQNDLIAYFCAEFGFHESFPIYSGGLGILAGDHCKAASDLHIPFVAIGLLYSKGYFTQTIDSQGNQLAHYTTTQFDDLPISPARDANSNEVRISVEVLDREVQLKVWQAKAGHIMLYLMDSNLPENDEQDRAITYQLYGGDSTTRIQQEIVLGVGGVRLLRCLGLKPTVWHINEGHAAFQIFERCQEAVSEGMGFDAALELCASGTVFTTHTPVPAGHDIFDNKLFYSHFQKYAERLGISDKQLFDLGSSPRNEEGFNMTVLALRSSRFHNGVSRIHGRVASEMESHVWPQIDPKENPISYVTNGVHLPTFLAREWVNLFDMRFSDWRNEMLNEQYWQNIDDIPDIRFWSVRQELKTVMFNYVCAKVTYQHRRNGVSENTIARITEHLQASESDILVLGFARRFATYKRATLIFSDLERLARILGNPQRPVIMIFAGKAHPHDMPGQHLIRQIHEFSMRPEFLGKVILLEGHDMALGRKMVAGVDVWINNPEYPLEASGTSGEKAGVNGVLNLSVLDGWWGEGYNGENGWAITPHGPNRDLGLRDQEEARELLDILEYKVVPLYFDRDHQGYSPSWVQYSKASMKSIIPHYSALRMFMDYAQGFYRPARDQYKRLSEDHASPAIELGRWKGKVRDLWPGVSMQLIHQMPTEIKYDEVLPIKVAVFLNGLSHKDIVVECLLGCEDEVEEDRFKLRKKYRLESESVQTVDTHVNFTLNLKPDISGLQYYKIRMYPYHPLLSHPFETGFMIWL